MSKTGTTRVTVKPGDLPPRGNTDWARLDAMSDEEVMAAALSDPDAQPLTPEELDATNFRTTTFVTDTRTLRFYYRKLPDNRVQIGSRSAITGAASNRTSSRPTSARPRTGMPRHRAVMRGVPAGPGAAAPAPG